MIELREVSKTFTTDSGEFEAVAPLSLDVAQGEIYGIIGFSGAGKSTLLRLVNLLERPTGGTIAIDGKELTALPKKELRKARQSIGMIFQHFNLLANKTVYENVKVALEISGYPKDQQKDRVEECLEIVGLLEKIAHYPAQLSGGQKQRVAIARALATGPKVLLCDEPTSALDPQTTEGILDFLQKINRDFGVTILLVTHEMSIVKKICHKVAVMENGRVVEKLDLANRGFVPKTTIAKLLSKEYERTIEEA